MLVLGIDPGVALTGWALIKKEPQVELVDYGCIRTSKRLSQSRRLVQIFRKLEKIIKKYKPEVLSLEKLFFNTNAKTALNVGEARGVVKICACLNEISLFEFTPLQIKTSIAGYGRANKKQVQEMVKRLLSLKEVPKPDDAADAVAAALTFCFYNQKLEK